METHIRGSWAPSGHGTFNTPQIYNRLDIVGMAQQGVRENSRVKMSHQCGKCNKEIEKQQAYEYQGNLFCEDCYMDILSPPNACDPWVVRSAQMFLKGKDKLSTLTPLQLNIVNCIKEKGESTIEEMMGNLNLTEEELRRDFAVLRHMEILGATRKGGKICYRRF
jgi:hypothetical protein